MSGAPVTVVLPMLAPEPRVVAAVRLRVPPAVLMEPERVLAPAPFRVTLRMLPVLPAMLAPLCMPRLLLAVRVRVRVAPDVLPMATAPPSALPLRVMLMPEMATSVVSRAALIAPSLTVNPPTPPVLMPLAMVTPAGSNSHRPALPKAAPASMRMPWASRLCLPEVSMKPPSPPWLPPRALMLPWAWVVASAQTMTLPPLPVSVASALRPAPASSVVVLALAMSGLAPWTSPPTRMVPPPLLPLTSITAWSVTLTFSPRTSTSPPLVPVAVTCDWPDTVALCVALRKMRPPSATALLALSVPLLRTTPATTPMWPLSARMLPRLTA